MKNSVKIILGIAVIAIVVLVAVIIKKYDLFNNNNSQVPAGGSETMTAEKTSPVSGFVWRYEDGEMDSDGFPKTKIFLDAKYDNGTVVILKIDEVQGSCNKVDPLNADKDIVSGSTKIQCYAAGFGEWYKIVKGDDSYEVRRKYFVESEPDSVPPEYHYEVVAEVSLFQ